MDRRGQVTATGIRADRRLSSRVDAGTLAVVDAYRAVRLPFGGWLRAGAVKVHAVARARSPVVP